jgi:hypothetical protein
LAAIRSAKDGSAKIIVCDENDKKNLRRNHFLFFQKFGKTGEWETNQKFFARKSKTNGFGTKVPKRNK